MMDTPVASSVIGFCLASLLVSKVLSNADIDGVSFHSFDKDAILGVLGFFYDECVELKREDVWCIDLKKIEPDDEKRKKALRKTIHAVNKL
jgi:hypothetical protein